MARFTIVSKTGTLYLFPAKGVAPFIDALPADLATDSEIDNGTGGCRKTGGRGRRKRCKEAEKDSHEFVSKTGRREASVNGLRRKNRSC